MEIVQLLSAAGIGGIIGSLLTTIVQSWLAHKSYLTNRNFQEKKEAYVGLWSSHLNIEKKDDDSARRAFIYWHMRCELVAPLSVRQAIQKVIDSNDGIIADRLQSNEELREVMRKDLGIQYTND